MRDVAACEAIATSLNCFLEWNIEIEMGLYDPGVEYLVEFDTPLSSLKAYVAANEIFFILRCVKKPIDVIPIVTSGKLWLRGRKSVFH